MRLIKGAALVARLFRFLLSLRKTLLGRGHAVGLGADGLDYRFHRRQHRVECLRVRAHAARSLGKAWLLVHRIRNLGLLKLDQPELPPPARVVEALSRRRGVIEGAPAT